MEKRFSKLDPFVLMIIVISFIALTDLFHPGLPVTHDGQDHVARIANFYQNLSEGNIIPRWASNLNWGYGHPILMFLYPLPSYIASLFHFLGFNFVDSTKIVFGLTFILSGTFMYIWLKEFLPRQASFIGGLLYMFAPYRFVDLYVRGAIGEHVAFTFLPLILYFLLRLYKERYSISLIAGGAISLAFLILSHNAISLMFLPVIFAYIVYLWWNKKFEKCFTLNTLYIILLGFGLAAFFWIPAFFEGKYTLRDIVTSEDYRGRLVEFQDLIYGTWNYGGTGQFSVQIGMMHWVLTILSIPLTVYFYIKRDRLWIMAFLTLITFLASVFMMLEPSLFIWDRFSILQKFQFPWRFLSLTVFASAVLSAIVVSRIKKYRILFIILIFLILLLNKNYWHVQGFLQKEESFYTGVYNSTTDTGESSPIWSVRFMEKMPKAHLEVIEGVANILKEVKRSSTYHEYQIQAMEKARLRENTLYFPGWNVLLDGKPVEIEFQDPRHRGLMTFFVDKGKHTIRVEFKETKLRQFADAISLFSIFILGFLTIKNLKFRRL